MTATWADGFETRTSDDVLEAALRTLIDGRARTFELLATGEELKAAGFEQIYRH